MSTQPKLVNKQFNSPIGLYSEDNIREAFERDRQILQNGTVRNVLNPDGGKLDFQNPSVLHLLQEENIRHGIMTGTRKVAWPPAQYDVEIDTTRLQNISTQGGPVNFKQQYSPQASTYQDIQSSKHSEKHIYNPLQSSYSVSKQWAPVSPPVAASRVPQYQNLQCNTDNNIENRIIGNQNNLSRSQHSDKQGYHQTVPPTNKKIPQSQSKQLQSTFTNQEQASFDNSNHQINEVPQGSTRSIEEPPTTITLRQHAPIRQIPNPIVTSEPATATLKGQVMVGGKHLRGDLKWPPENVRKRMREEQLFVEELAKGPAMKPLKQEKNYAPFFEAHALHNTYPGYKIPPGTQFYRPL